MIRTASVFAIVVGAFVVGTWPVLAKIGRRWLAFDEAYSHGLMMFAVALYLVVRTWRSRPPAAGFYPVWLLPLALIIGTYVIAALLYVEAVQQFLLIPMLLVAIAAISGFATTWRLLLPIGVLVFALPFWDYTAYPLQLITTQINEIFLGLWDIEFEIEGVLVFLPGIGAFEVTHSCSGLRYLLIAMSLATIYSELNYRLWRNRIILFSVAVVLALVTNWIRVFVIIYMGYITEMETSLVRDHEFFGWVLFAVALIPLFTLAGRLERGNIEEGPQGTENGRQPLLVYSHRAVVAGIVVGLFLLSPVSVYALRGGNEVTQNFSMSLEGSEDWAPLFQRMAGFWEHVYTGEDHHNRKAWFLASEDQIEQMPKAYSAAHVLTYETQSPGKELISDRNRIVDTERWFPQDNFSVTVDGHSLSGLRLKDRRTGEPAVVVYGYYVSGMWAGDPFGAKLLQLYAAINGRQDASLVAVSVQCSDCDPETRAREWAEQIMPQAQRALDVQFEAKPG